MKNFHLSLLFTALLGVGFLFAGVEVSGSPEAKINKDSLFATFESGGVLMWPILLCSLAGVAYGIERFFSLQMSKVLPTTLLQKYQDVLQRVRQGDKNPAMLQELVTDGSSEGAILFKKYLQRDLKSLRDSEQILQEYVEVSKWHMQKNIKPLGIIANVCPLLGLFGTVVGMIKAFDVVADQGLGKPELLANGMAIALLTTGFGLGVAIPVSLVYHHLMEKSAKMTLRLYQMLHDLTLDWLSEKPESVQVNT